MAPVSKKFVVDTNVLIEFSVWIPMGWEFWSKIEKTLEDKRWVLLNIVENEILYEGDLKEWCKRQKGKMLTTEIDDSVREKAVEIDNQYKMIDQATGKSAADPYIIAFALKNGFGIFTREASKLPTDPLFKIPDVCEKLKIYCTKRPKIFYESIGL